VETISSEARLVLAIAPPGAHPLRFPLSKRITTIGSDQSADIRVAALPAHWAVVHRGDESVELLLASTGVRTRLKVGEVLEADGATVGLESVASAREREQAIESLVSALAAVDSADHAVELLLRGLIAASGADIGALILAEGEQYTVAAARDRAGAVLENSTELLSDTIVRDVLETGDRIQLDDVTEHSRYRAIPSSRCVAAIRI
jgi:hypothetical protein